MLRELANIIASQLGEVPEDRRKANVPRIFKNYRPVSLTSVPQKVMEQIFQKPLPNTWRTRGVIRSSQHGFLGGEIMLNQPDCLL